MSELSHGDEARRALADKIASKRRSWSSETWFRPWFTSEEWDAIEAALRAEPARAVEAMRELRLALRDAEPTIMLTTISDGPAIELIIDEREAAIRLYEALEDAVGPSLPIQPAADGGAE